MKSRPLSMETMLTVLADTAEYGHVNRAELKYHRDRLFDAELLPV